MFFKLPESARDEVEAVESLLREHNPWPRREFGRFAELAASTPDGQKRFADFRRVVVDLDGLLQDTRWAIGNSLLILRAFPEVSKPLSDEFERFDAVGAPTKAHLALAGLVVGKDRVIFEDLLDRQPGGRRVGRWMIRILADHAVNATIAMLDRLAHLLLLAANVRPPRGRMYFRSGRLTELREKPGIHISDTLIGLASGKELEFLLAYRDGYAHTVRLNTSAMGTAAVDHYLGEAGERVTVRAANYSAEELVGIALMGLELTRTALWEVGSHCETMLKSEGVVIDVIKHLGGNRYRAYVRLGTAGHRWASELHEASRDWNGWLVSAIRSEERHGEARVELLAKHPAALHQREGLEARLSVV